MRFFVSIARGSQALFAGHVDAAQRLASEALQIGTASGQADAAEFCGAQLFFIRWQQGRLKEAIPSLNRGAAETPDFMPASASLALAEALGGQPERARRLLHAAAGKGFAGRTVGWLISHCLWAEVAVELNDHDVAGVLYERLLPWRHLFATSGPFPLHAVAHSLGRLAALNGQFQEANENFAEALAVHQRLQAPFCIAATQRAWGHLLLPHDPDRADRLLANATTIAARHGYGYLQRPFNESRASLQPLALPLDGRSPLSQGNVIK
jgi:tetratricopeptide (TPR) repeat protein